MEARFVNWKNVERQGMSDRRYASTAEVAAAFNVSITTVKRWVDDGLLPAQKTAGGHRRLLVSDVLRVAHSGGFPLLDVKRLGISRRGRRSPADPKELASQLLPAFLAGDTLKARLLLDAYRGGMRADVLADAVVAPFSPRSADNGNRDASMFCTNIAPRKLARRRCIR